MFEIKNLDKSFQQPVLKDLSLSLPKGQVHGIVGLNGAGKSTLLNCIAGLLQMDAGEILFDGQPLERKQIAYLETNNFFYSRITGKEYLDLFKISNPNFPIDDWNELFELPLKKLIETYSTGMKKKLAFMGVLCLDKPFMMLDEPFNGLDLETNQKLRLIIEKLRAQGKTVLVTSHILETLTSNCDTISHLFEGVFEDTLSKENFGGLEEQFFKLQQDRSGGLIDRLME